MSLSHFDATYTTFLGRNTNCLLLESRSHFKQNLWWCKFDFFFKLWIFLEWLDFKDSVAVSAKHSKALGTKFRDNTLLSHRGWIFYTILSCWHQWLTFSSWMAGLQENGLVTACLEGLISCLSGWLSWSNYLIILLHASIILSWANPNSSPKLIMIYLFA